MPLDVHSLNGLKSSGPMPSFDLRSVSKSFVHPECMDGGVPINRRHGQGGGIDGYLFG